MGTPTMGSHDKSDRLTKLYNLTLDKVQHQLGDLGKPLNLDELIKSVWTAETEANQGQDMKNSVDGSNDDNLDRKTVTCEKEKQPTLGEMTLEDFLAKAGIAAESSQEKKDLGLGAESVVLPQQDIDSELARWMQYQIPLIKQQHAFNPGHHPAQQVTGDVAYPEAQMTVSSDAQTPGRKRVSSGDLMEKTVERRQKRMIKNRESAARSRARKQAYTHGLESKVSCLEEENERLKREQEAEKALPFVPPPEPRYQLRRTSSALF